MDAPRKTWAERMAETRAKFPPGPWRAEPDKLEFEHKGVPCIILRQPGGGHLCGYAAVPPGHPWHGVDMAGGPIVRCVRCRSWRRKDWEAEGQQRCACGGETEDFYGPEVHGGVTYSEVCAGEVCHVPKPGEPDNVWWLGFDCAHAWDVSPAREYTLRMYDTHYRSLEYVKGQCARLAEQILEAANG